LKTSLIIQNLNKMEINRDVFEESEQSELVLKLIESHYPEYTDENFHLLDEVTKNFVLYVNMDGQIGNGGIVQFIDNSTGTFFEETIQMSKSIDCIQLTEILTKVKELFPYKIIPKDWEARRNLWDKLCEENETNQKWDEEWEKLDDDYYNIEKVIQEKIVLYLKEKATII